jgi:N6-L-threonylcarbamoyladenine synthase
MKTAAAVVRDGREIIASVISSQIPIHKRFGGVVPELASREHLDKIVPVVNEALERAGITSQDIDGIAVTIGPGLVGSLLVGVSYAKAMAYALKSRSWELSISRVTSILSPLRIRRSSTLPKR